MNSRNIAQTHIIRLLLFYSLTEGQGFMRGQKLDLINQLTSIVKLKLSMNFLVGQGPRELNFNAAYLMF